MTISHLLIRFGELSLKGENRKDFIKKLVLDLKERLENFDVEIIKEFDFLVIRILKAEQLDRIVFVVKNTPGIYNFSLTYKVQKNVDEIVNTSLNIIKETNKKTFKLFVKRSDKSFPLNSDELINKVAGQVLKNTNLKVDVHNPQVKFKIDIKEDGCYLSFETIKGLGGLPLGSLGKVMMFISGGIDSPVAAYTLIRRGLKLEFIHFASPPYTSAAVIDKIKDILNVLNKYEPFIKLHIIPFTKIQEKIYEISSKGYEVTLLRRMMMKIGEKIASESNCDALASGESIGQVASQTLGSLNVISKNTSIQILRPLCVMDKEEIIRISKEIGTYEISIRPFEDCCTIFPVKCPKTKPRIQEVEFLEKKANFDLLVEEAISSREIICIKKASD